ncbi:hypothetical protein FQJ88_04525 [Xanthomonas vasicola]|uniref:Uncharacterized protein n=1 Tax=Xanthomonas vasicola TaxID=56459 RepID=A0ABD7S3R1_XANVA|nr:hypothetical protein NX81_002970 [Xanthomonas vasicola]TWQ26825.1 hypothetical protein FQJ97_02940 [Xanthomonas vasicola]TWQ40982.1 hypothetical protein FQJ96_04105 [Xanthomonas vasicola]TWQ48804.1 hypothetical protein FQK01_23125 [Xanthomonas vasicola]TWQ58037.1 hypothetical protein FQJ94_05220 [Xanthomonas vasicola]
MRANGARALERPRRKRGPGRGAEVGVRVRGEALVDPTSTRLRPSPHPPLHATFSRWEKVACGGSAACWPSSFGRTAAAAAAPDRRPSRHR